jgi:4-hydroxybenzoate polyprenyltransferase
MMPSEPSPIDHKTGVMQGALWRSAIRVLRLHQWIKNVLVFAPLVLGGKAGEFVPWRDAAIGFLAFGLAASGTYVVNDILDRSSDRRHWSKRTRPIASGDMSILQGALIAVVAIPAGLALAATLQAPSMALLATYVALTLSYSVSLKSHPIVDVAAIAALFTLRLAFGTALANVPWSPWLMVLSMSAFLSLALAKRFAEILRSTTREGQGLRRGYRTGDLHFVRSLGLASATTAVLIMILYLIEEAFPHQVYSHPLALWIVPVLLFLFFARIWLKAERNELDDDPVEYALRDPACLCYAAALALMFAVAIH